MFAELGPGHALAQGAELRRCFSDAASAEQVCVREWLQSLVEDSERVRRCGSKVRPGSPGRRGGMRSRKGGMFDREVSEDERDVDEVVRWRAGRWQRLDLSLQEVEAARTEATTSPFFDPNRV